MVTKEHLKEILEGLVILIDNWNDCAADGDRGRDNNAICITIWDDGSGRLGTMGQYDFDEMNVQCKFHNVDELTEYLNGWMKLNSENTQQGDKTSDIERAARVVESFARYYPPNIFTPPPPGEHGKIVDSCSAAAIREILPNIAEEIRKLQST